MPRESSEGWNWKHWKLWAAAALSAALLVLPFPIAGPMPVSRSVFAWFGLAPLLWAILDPDSLKKPRPLRRAFLLAYFCGVLWYSGNCYWVRDVMASYGDMPPLAPTLLLLGFSLVLGLYFAFFGLGVALVRQATGSTRLALAAAPFLWAGLELAASRITSVPWDQLGYSQVDNGLVNQLAPFTGVYGISFLLVLANAFIAGAFVVERCPPKSFLQGPRPWGIAGVVLMIGGTAGIFLAPPNPPTTATAVLIQPNLDVGSDARWTGPGEWDRHIAEFIRLGSGPCASGSPNDTSSSSEKTYIAGIPQTGAPNAEIDCAPTATPPDLVVWPESPAPFFETDERFQRSLVQIAAAVHAPLVVGNVGADFSTDQQQWLFYNSALVVRADGSRAGRYDKIHLVPFGEYVPFQRWLTFARKLTGRVSSFTRGSERQAFLLNGHRYGVFICYEAVFADEVRQFSKAGAEVLVNISDDGWYGDTSAPWQHLNMVRMRAIENRRWILRDTNNGVTAAIDPYGRVRQSIPRHQAGALPAAYGFRDDITFYSAHGDLFGWACAILGLGIVVWSAQKCLNRSPAPHSIPKSGLQSMSLNDLEFAYAPVRDQVRDLREYL
jgi:apolipoprotein N-acyltransferase